MFFSFNIFFLESKRIKNLWGGRMTAPNLSFRDATPENGILGIFWILRLSVKRVRLRMTWGQFGVSMTKKQGTKFVSCFFVAFGSKVQAVWIEQKIIYIDDKNTIFIIVHRNKTASYDNFFEIVINFC